MGGTIIFVHGTGVRFDGYTSSYNAAVAAARSVGITADFKQCLWGDPLGVQFEGKSLPDSPSAEDERAAAAEDEAWAWRFDDPLLELVGLTTPGVATGNIDLSGVTGKPEWQARLDTIRTYVPGPDAQALLVRAQLEDFWTDAWCALKNEPVLDRAFEQSSKANELADCEAALARAVISVLHNAAIACGRPGPDAAMRVKLIKRLGADWGFVYGLGSALQTLLARAATSALRRNRNPLNRAIAAQIGDILLYQSRGEKVRGFIRAAIAAAEPPVTLVAHSLGGIACVDLLASDAPPPVAALVTMGSQAPYFYEIGALIALRPHDGLPVHFPAWLNLFDRNDFLSFVGARLFEGRVQDHELRSGQPFPASHSAYLTSEDAWRAVRGILPQ